MVTHQDPTGSYGIVAAALTKSGFHKRTGFITVRRRCFGHVALSNSLRLSGLADVHAAHLLVPIHVPLAPVRRGRKAQGKRTREMPDHFDEHPGQHGIQNRQERSEQSDETHAHAQADVSRQGSPLPLKDLHVHSLVYGPRIPLRH